MAITSRLSFNTSQYTTGTGAYTVSTTTATGPLAGDTIYWFGVCDAANCVPTPPAGYTVQGSSAVGPSISVAIGSVTVTGAQTVTATKPAGVQSSVFVLGYVLGGANPTPDVVVFNPASVASTTITAPTVNVNGANGYSLSVFADRAGGGAITAGSIAPAASGSVAAPVANNADVAVARWALTAAGNTGTRTAPCATANLWNAVSVAISVSGTPQNTTPTGTMNFLPYLGLGTGVSR